VAGSSYALSATSVVFYAKWTAVSQEPSAAPVVPTPSVAGAPSVAAAPPSTTGGLGPIVNASNVNIPVAGVSSGQSLLLENGVPTRVQIAPNEESSPTGLVASGDGFWMRLAGRGGNGDPLRLGVQAQLVLQSIQSGARSGSTSSPVACVVGRPMAEASGMGLRPGSQVRLYVLPSTDLGSITVGSDGSYSGSVPVPSGLALGAHTLQANGFSSSGSVRSLSLGVQVVPARVAVNRKASARVLFRPMSPVISAQGRKALNALARQAGTSGKRTVVVGFVKPKSSTSDRTLSTKRARAVAAYLKSKGLRGTYQVRVERISGKGNRALRVSVATNYQPGC
jgi:flagellar motor protein MotB